MAVENYLLPLELLEYSRRVSLREAPVLAELRAETAEFPGKNMQVSLELGQFLGFLAELTGARRILELGTFTGYSTLAMAMAMGPEGRIIACDVNEPAHVVARKYWKKAGVEGRIDLRVGECADILEDLRAEKRQGYFDMALVDADKPGYADYLEHCLVLLRPGGLMVFDNVFMNGDVLADPPKGKYTASMQRFNESIHHDERVSIITLPLGDGITLARKRG